MSRGFTLLEVMVALAVLALALGALIKTAGQSAGNIDYLRTQTLASWVARNQINRILLERDWPDEGTRRGTADMADQSWRWEVEISNTADEDLRRLDVTVGFDGEQAVLIETSAFKKKPEQP